MPIVAEDTYTGMYRGEGNKRATGRMSKSVDMMEGLGGERMEGGDARGERGAWSRERGERWGSEGSGGNLGGRLGKVGRAVHARCMVGNAGGLNPSYLDAHHG